METGRRKKMRIAVARDPAFNFIYRENLDRLAESGNLTFFSPVYGSDLPDADLVYLPGGYPELFARQLHRRKRMMQQLRDYAESGGKVFAECGGMMFLTRSLTARKGGTAYQMTGLLPVDCTMEMRVCIWDTAGWTIRAFPCAAMSSIILRLPNPTRSRPSRRCIM